MPKIPIFNGVFGVFCLNLLKKDNGYDILLVRRELNLHWFHIANFPVTAVNPLKILTPVRTDKAEGFVKIQSTGNASSTLS